MLLSIVTPAYNRAHLLGRCYDSLRKQTDMDFEWIIVDDGSIDNTREVCEKIAAEENNFPVRYIWKENGGKHTALNAAHPYLHGRYVLILDSDDFLTEDAVEEVRKGWKLYEDNEEIGLITFLKGEDINHPNCYAKDEYKIVDIIRYQRTCVRSSDCCEVIRTELFKQYPFPVIKGERFLAETPLWYRVGYHKKCVYINKVIYICEYLEGGLTDGGRSMRTKNPKGGMYTSYLRMHPHCLMKERVRAALLYVCYGHYAGYGFLPMLRQAKSCACLVGLAYLPGSLLYLVWKRKY